jgi:MFS family permease
MTENKRFLTMNGTSGRSSQAYIVATAFLSLFALVGIAYYGLPFFYDFMTREYGWSRAVVTSGNAVGKLLVGPLFGFVAGWMIDRYGPRRLMISGSIMMGVSLIGLGFSSSLPMFYLFWIFNAIGYVFGGPLPCQVLISRWFDKNRGKAMGIAYLGIGTGGALVPLFSAGLEKEFGWHLALGALGILIVLIALPMAWFIKEPKLKIEGRTPTQPMVPISNILKNPYFYLLAIGSMSCMGAVGGISQHIKYYLNDLHFSQSEAAHVMSLVLVFSLVGRVLMGWLADVIHRKYVMILIYLLVAVSIPLLLIPDFPGRIYLFSVLFGIGLGGNYMIIPLMAADLFGVRALGRTMGIILVADGVAESVFPMLVGAMYNDVAKSYAFGFTLLICLALTGAIIVSLLPKTSEFKGKDFHVEQG